MGGEGKEGGGKEYKPKKAPTANGSESECREREEGEGREKKKK